MNKTFLSIVTGVMLSSTALADGFDTGVYGGVNFSSDYGASSKWFDASANPETGSVIGFVVGKEITGIKGLVTQIEIGTRSNKLDPNLVLCGDSYEGLRGRDGTDHIMLNAKYAFDTGFNKISAYGLVGGGWGSRSVKVIDGQQYLFDQAKFSESDFVWQVGAGLQAPVGDNNTLGIGYRYFEAPHIDISAGPVQTGTEDGNHSIVLEMTHAFN